MKEIKEKKIKQKTGLPIASISASAIKCYLTCQRLFYYQSVMRVKLPLKSMPLVFGIAIHKAIEEYYRGFDPVKVFKSVFKPEGIAPPLPKEDGSEKTAQENFDEHMEEGIAMMKTWKLEAPGIHKKYGISMRGTSEVRFRVYWKNPANGERLVIAFSGIYDRLTGNEIVLEFKTSSKPYKKEDVDTYVQSDSYLFTYYLQHGRPPKNFIYIVFIKGRKGKLIQILETSRTRANYSQIFNLVKTILDAIKYKKFKDYKKGTGFLHKYCDCWKFEEMLLI